VRLLGDDGTQYGIVTIHRARELAQEQGLDLVEVSPTAKPPVVKLIDYGKFKYDAQKKASEAKKKQIVIQIKEIQFRPNIEAHDIDTKLNQADKFLHQGDKIKLVMQFRGRENAYKEAGQEKFKGIVERILQMGAIIEAEAKLMGNRIIAVVAPDKKIMKQVQEMVKKKAKTTVETEAKDAKH
jgi:translation initiation factor IF-3